MINAQMLKCSGGSCKYHCGYVDNDLITKRSDDLAKLAKATLFVVSGARCPQHNKDEGGASDSQHCQKCAIDGMYQLINGTYIDTKIVACIAEITGWFSGIAPIKGYKSLHTDTGNRNIPYRGDENVSFDFSTKSLLAYYGINKLSLISYLIVPENYVAKKGNSNYIYNMSGEMALKIKGFYNGAIDGILGPQFDAAARAFQTAAGGLTVDGALGSMSLPRLYAV